MLSPTHPGGYAQTGRGGSFDSNFFFFFNSFSYVIFCVRTHVGTPITKVLAILTPDSSPLPLLARCVK